LIFLSFLAGGENYGILQQDKNTPDHTGHTRWLVVHLMSCSHTLHFKNIHTGECIYYMKVLVVELDKRKYCTSESISAKLRESMSISKSNYNNTNPKPLSISIQSSQNIVNGKGISSMSAIAYNTVTGKKIDNAIIRLKIIFTSSGTSKEFVGRNRQVICSAELISNSNNNNNSSYRATVRASAPGYISTMETATSFSTSISITTSNSKSG